MADETKTEPRRLAAVIFGRDEDVDAEIHAFVAAARAGRARVAGFLQVRVDNPDCGCDDVRLRDIETGAELAIMQDLGPGAEGCRVDTAAVAAAAAWLGRTLAAPPDLLVVNRFGKLESEGGGLRAELSQAAALGVPLLAPVPSRFRDAWAEFAGDLADELPPSREAMAMWWHSLERTASGE